MLRWLVSSLLREIKLRLFLTSFFTALLIEFTGRLWSVLLDLPEALKPLSRLLLLFMVVVLEFLQLVVDDLRNSHKLKHCLQRPWEHWDDSRHQREDDLRNLAEPPVHGLLEPPPGKLEQLMEYLLVLVEQLAHHFIIELLAVVEVKYHKGGLEHCNREMTNF